MNELILTQLHLDLLRALASPGVREYGLRMEDLCADMRCGRHRELSQPDCARALRDLSDKSFAHSLTSASGMKRWQITAKGEAVLKEEGL